MRDSSQRLGLYRIRSVVLTLLLVLAVLLLASCGRDSGELGEPGVEDRTQSVTTQNPITLEELTKRPAKYYEQSVNVEGTIGRTLSSNSFSLTSPGVADEDTEVQAALVAGERGDVPNLSEGQRVRVVGEARRYDPSEIQEELGIDLDNDLHAPFEERPVIILGSVEMISGGETTGQ